ncbi:hypothetical protein L6V77_08995 [Myxococcota bacterium]|nr:hypothetical protein [Myxococcota bacterium]
MSSRNPSPSPRVRQGEALGLVAVLLSSGVSAVAEASPCCAGSTTPGFEHLALWEKVAGGARLGGEFGLGQWDAAGHWRGHEGYEETVSRFELWVVGRPLEPLQLGARLPWLHTARRAGALSDDGGGVGDLAVSVRWDVFPGGEGPGGLGVAGVLGLVTPTGRDTARASGLLGADATGEGSFTPSVGLVLMRPWDTLFVRLQGSVGRPLTHTVDGTSHRAGVDLNAALVGGVSPVPPLTLSLSVDVRRQADATMAGRTVADSGRSGLFGALGAAWDLPGRLEILALQATLRAPVAVDGVGRNTLAGVGVTLGLRAGWP